MASPQQMQHEPENGMDVHKETVTAGSTSEPVLIGSRMHRVSAGVTPGGGGTGRVEYTFDTIAEIIADNARWYAWADGDVSTATANSLVGPITAVRCVAATANAGFDLCGAVGI